MSDSIDEISFKIPLKPQYANVIRLTVSGVCARLGMDIDTIEDIKVSVTEIFNMMVGNVKDSESSCDYTFIISAEKLDIYVGSEDETVKSKISEDSDEISLSIIRSLMDHVEYVQEGKFRIKITKEIASVS